MGVKEDLVRDRLAEEKREKEHREKMKVNDKLAVKQASEQLYDQLMADINQETVRVAQLLEEADWSKAHLATFIGYRKRKWLWKKRVDLELACLRFWHSGGNSFSRQAGDRGLVMDSRGDLWLDGTWNFYRALRTVEKEFADVRSELLFDSGGEHSECKMIREVLEHLKNFQLAEELAS